ncbi:MAG: aldo/keto reductase, partial [Acidimicrobiia bacterium]|nr:aldo/keto reductase [Acidimicrobiia bacterium]
MTIDKAPFGRTGHRSSRVIYGAAAFWAMPAEKAAGVLDTALAAGVNHIDTAAAYGDSELALAPWLQTHRADV